MANTLGNYNPTFFAQEALIQLEKALGMAARVHRGYEQERNTTGRSLGDTINIRKPSTFTAQAAPSTAQDLATESTSIVLSSWQEVKFKLTDKELAYTGERIIQDHIRPAAYALADKIDSDLVALYTDVPWIKNLNAAGSIAVADITNVRQVLFDNAVPLGDPSMMHYMVSGAVENEFLQLAAFTQQQGAGDRGVMSQLRGSLGTKFGLEIFANQNTPTHNNTSSLADGAGALTAAVAKGATSLGFDAVTASYQFRKGDTFTIAGNSQRYALTADVASDGSGVVAAASFTPSAAQAYSDNDVITFDIGDTKPVNNLAFHRNAFALGFARLPDIADRMNLGARITSVADPVTGLAVRARIYYVGNSSEVHVALDVLYGLKTLDGNLAARARF